MKSTNAVTKISRVTNEPSYLGQLNDTKRWCWLGPKSDSYDERMYRCHRHDEKEGKRMEPMNEKASPRKMQKLR